MPWLFSAQLSCPWPWLLSCTCSKALVLLVMRTLKSAPCSLGRAVVKSLRLFSVLVALSLRTGGLHCAKRCGPRTDKPVGLQPGHLPALSLTFDVGRRAGVEGSSESLGHRGEGSDLVQGLTLPIQRAWLFLYSAPHFPNPVPLPWVSVPGLSY